MTEITLLDMPIEHARTTLAEASSIAEKFVQRVQAGIDSALELSEMVRVPWDTMQRIAQVGQAELPGVLHGVYFHQIAQCLDIMRQVRLQAEQAALLAGEQLQRTDRLTARITDLENFQREILAAGKHPQPSPRFLTGINTPPLRLDEHGDVYVGQSRVLLDTIVEEFNAGTPPPDIVRGYDTVAPADVYATIAYYLRYKDEVDAYLQRRDTEASALWNEIDSTQPSKADLKAQIKERWSSRKVTNASSAE